MPAGRFCRPCGFYSYFGRKQNEMNKKNFSLKTKPDIKVFLLFLLDNVGYPMEHKLVIDMVSENTEEIIFDYDECLRELSEDGHLLYDEFDGEKFYMISDSGRMISRELYDRLDKGFRERSLKYAAKYISLTKNGAAVKSTVSQTDDKRYRVTMQANDSKGEIMSLSIVVNSKEEAEKIKANYEARPDGVYRGILFSATGRLEFLS